MSLRRVMTVVPALAGIAVLAIAAMVTLAFTLDLRPLVTRQAAAMLGRQLTIGGLRLSAGNPLRITLEDVRLANPAWGSKPDMVRVGRLAGELDPWPLLRGVVRFRRLAAEGVFVVLERDEKGVGNWRFSAPTAKGPKPAQGSERAMLPIVLDLSLRDSHLTYRTTSGAILRVDLKDAALRATGDDQPISLTGDGAYNDLPVHLNATMQSFDVLRDPTVPYGVVAVAANPDMRIDFDGTAQNPLGFDLLQGKVSVRIDKQHDLAALLDLPAPDDVPVALTARMTKNDNIWRLTEIDGRLAGNVFTGTLDLEEGRREGARLFADHVRVALEFTRLDVDPVLAMLQGTSQTATPRAPLRLRVDADPGVLLEAQIAAKQLTLGGFEATDLTLHASVLPGKVTVAPVSLAFLGGAVTAGLQATAAPEGAGSAVSVGIAATGADLTQVVRLLGGDTALIRGKVDVHASLDMTGETLKQALANSRGQMVIGMNQGQLARQLIQLASSDVRLLFRKGEGMTPIACFLGIVDLRNGVGSVSPFRVRTGEGTLFGGGRVDLPRQVLDLKFATESKTTSFYALDVPVRISGAFKDPSIRPVLKSAAKELNAQASVNANRLPEDIRPFALKNPCLR